MIDTKEKENWTDLYRRALCEEDGDKLPELVEQAHRAVQARVRGWWYSLSDCPPVSDKERRELDAAEYYLGLLASLQARKLPAAA